MAPDAVLCGACGHQLESGPPNAVVDAELPMVTAPSLLERLGALVEWLKGHPKLAGGLTGGVLLLLLLMVSLPGGDSKEGQIAEHPSESGEEAEHMASRAPDRPLTYQQRLELSNRLRPMETAEIARELAVLGENDRREVVVSVLSNRLAAVNRGGAVSGEDLAAFLALGRELSPEGLKHVLEDAMVKSPHRKMKLLAPRNWEEHGLAAFMELPLESRAAFAVQALRQLSAEGTSIPAFILWHGALAEALADSLKGPNASRLAFDPHPFTRQTADRMLSQVVLLRHGTTQYAGVCVARDEELTVLTQPIRPFPVGTPPTAVWEAATVVEGERSWVPATRSLDTADPYREDQRAPCPHLLVFPLVGALAAATPARFAPTPTGPAYRLHAPASAEIPVPMPAKWRLAPVQPRSAPPRFRGTIDSLHFTGDGELAAIQTFAAPVVEEALRQQLLIQEVTLAPGGNGPLVATYAVWDARKALARVTARVSLESSIADGRKAEKTYVENLSAMRKDRTANEEPAFADAAEIPLELTAGGAVLRIGSPSADGSPMLVQLRTQLADGKVRYLPPSLFYAATNRPAGRGQWLVTEAAKRFIEARAKCLPLALEHTVDGMHRRYGDVAVVYLALKPKSIVMDQTATHIHVADAAGIRRIRLRDFRETVGLSIPGEVTHMTASSLGLVVAIRSAGKLTLQVFDPETLASKFSLPIVTAPTHLLSNWQTSQLVAVNEQNICLVDLATKKLVGQVSLAGLTAAPPGAKGAVPKGELRAAALSADAKEVRLTIGDTVRRLTLLENGLRAVPVAAGLRRGLATEEQYIIAGTRIYDLRSRPPQVTSLIYHRPLAVDLPSGRILARPLAAAATGMYSLLDRRGVEITNWLSGSVAKTPEPHHVLVHPDGTHYLLWSPSSACWVTLNDGGGTK